MAYFLSGLLLGLSAGMRLTMIVAVVPFVFALERGGPGGRRVAQFARSCLFFTAGLLMALLPGLLLFMQAPANAMFNNAGYHVLNAQLVADPLVGWWQRKGLFLLREVLTVPGNLLLVLCGVVFALMRPHREEGGGRQKEQAFAGAIACFMLLGALVPDPAQLQYFFAILPFAIIVVMGQFAALQPDRMAFASRVLAAGVLLTALFGLPAYRFLWNARAPHDWIPLKAHSVGEQIAECAAGASVITIAPAYVLEGGGRIPVQCAAGSFGWRAGALLSEDKRRQLRLAAPSDLDDIVTLNAPAVLLTGTERPNEEGMFRDYVERHGWGSRPIDKQLTLHGASF
jgi:hypothetical protein